VDPLFHTIVVTLVNLLMLINVVEVVIFEVIVSRLVIIVCISGSWLRPGPSSEGILPLRLV